MCETPDEALRLVLAHEVKVNDGYATSAATMVDSTAEITVKNLRYVSRGGLKLAGALEAFSLDVAGLRCIDVGCSTGGFTDCLLQAGAAEVTAVDVGYGDFAWKLRTDPRVHLFERTNIRTADAQKLGAPFDLIVADLSFIGLAGLAPTFASLAATGTRLMALVKPQFESHAGETDDHGFVASETVRERTVEEVSQALAAAGFVTLGVEESPITGRKSKNIEYLLLAIFS